MAKVKVNVQLTFDVEENPRIPLDAVKAALVLDVNETLASEIDELLFNIYNPHCTITVSDKEDTDVRVTLDDTNVLA